MSSRPIRISINALGGQGGGVLADWLVSVAEAEGWVAQSTSVPGVAQRTGATVYYLEMAPAAPRERQPVFALMPTPGDVDVVIASELMEAGRAIARGLVTPGRTVLVLSTHRIYAISEKSALGDGRAGDAAVLAAAVASARRVVSGDFQALAEEHGSVISATLLGALASSGALPFPRSAFEAAIASGGVGVAASLVAFEAAFSGRPPQMREAAPAARSGAGSHAVRIAALPAPVREGALVGVARAKDYQDGQYAGLYLERLARIAAVDEAFGGAAMDWRLSRETARYLALWMTYEDVVRVADLKTRASRFDRFRSEVRAGADQIVHVTEFMHPRFEEFCDTLPRAIGRRLVRSSFARRLSTPILDKDRRVATSRLGGFLLLWSLSKLRRLRPGSLRYSAEQARIDAWLARAVEIARADYDLAVEVIGLQRLVKGYGDTHANGLRNYARILDGLNGLEGAPGAAARLATLKAAALRDDEGRSLDAALSGAVVSPAPRRGRTLTVDPVASP